MAEAGWHELRVAVHGRPVFVRRGPEIPLVHVHGFTVSGRYLLPTARALAHRATTVVPDLPGYGQSAAWGHALGIGSLAWALREVLDALGLERVVLVGNSMGAPVCLEVAHSAPERVAGPRGPILDLRTTPGKGTVSTTTESTTTATAVTCGPRIRRTLASRRSAPVFIAPTVGGEMLGRFGLGALAWCAGITHLRVGSAVLRRRRAGPGRR